MSGLSGLGDRPPPRSSVTGQHTRRLTDLIAEAQYGASGPINQSRPNSDPQNQTAASLLSLNNTARVVLATITDCTAVANVYRVQFEKLHPPMVAVRMTRTTCSVSGVRDLGTLQAGSFVICLVHPQLSYAVIVGVIPTINTRAITARSAVLFGSTRARVDDAHMLPLRMHDFSQIPDFNAVRPFDATMSGEDGVSAGPGPRIFTDQYLATLGVDDATGVTAFVHDQLLRVAGYNLEMLSAGMYRFGYHDGLECSDWTGFASFPWEQLGNFHNGGNSPIRVHSAETWQLKQPWLNSVEPADPLRMPFHREREFHGYLGQGGKKVVQAPPVLGEVSRYGDGLIHPGLFDQTVTAAGRWLVQAATGISLAKRPAIIAATQLAKPEQPAPKGDSVSNYRFAGLLGEGEAQHITNDIRTSEVAPNLNRARGLLDMHAYFFNFAGSQPFAYHRKDYALPDEADLAYVDGVSTAVPLFDDLAAVMYIRPEAYRKKLLIDHRYGEQDIYQLPCGLDLLDDGSVAIYGGCGEEILLTGGSIIDSCPGDRWIKPGRDAITWAGRSSITRAYQSVDVTASYGDIRHKAENNYQILAGNSGTGGILIESKARGSVYNFEEGGEATLTSGITFKAADSDIVGWSANIYLRTGGGDVRPGLIYLDAARGTQSIITNSDNLVHYLSGSTFHYFGGSGDTSKANAFSASGAALCGQLAVSGGGILGGNLAIKGNIAVAGGHIATEQGQSIPFVGALEDPALNQIYDAVTQAQTTIDTELPKSGRDLYATGLRPQFYDDGRAGNETVITDAGVSLRRVEDYGTQGFYMFEDRWQQLARLSGQDGRPWIENPVLFRGSPTYPYPGRENFEDDTLYEQDLKLFDAATGQVAKRRTGADALSDLYANPAFATPRRAALNTYKTVGAR